MVVEEPKSA